MSNEQKRFYLSHYDNNPERDVRFKDIGNLLKIAGVLYQGMGSNLLLLSPSAEAVDLDTVELAMPSLEEWSEIIRQSDNPEVFVGEEGSIIKALHRKQRYEISGAVQQQIWARDGFRCKYCNLPMGKVQLTVDHFVPLEEGGKNDTTNYISACRRCNKEKGNIMPQEFCGVFYEELRDYLVQVSKS